MFYLLQNHGTNDCRITVAESPSMSCAGPARVDVSAAYDALHAQVTD